ncbi:hypothetical protein C8J57DRAFT_1498938 [Mycena rebaudengoi]|nr:hypothetical protein C8J57DRAFT_1498938 [Mycena rebaudengoi]
MPTGSTIDLSFQSFEAELASLPGKYAPERGGEILLVYLTEDDNKIIGDREPLGCVALRDITSAVEAFDIRTGFSMAATSGKRIGEAKRLIMEVARKLHYDEVRLDTLPHMQGAIKLYERKGFRESQKYYETTLKDTIFMRCVLDEENDSS